MPQPIPNRFIKQFIPPLLSGILSRRKKYGWKGDFANWKLALEQSGTYDRDNILEKVRQATEKIIRGEARYERDSVLFDTIPYSWPLLSALLWVASLNEGRLKVADFGGSLGSSYFQNREFFTGLTSVEWNIIEQENFVRCGRELFKNQELKFFYSLDELIEQQGRPDILLLSCTIPYLEEPYVILRKLIERNIPYIVIDNTYFNDEPRNRICIQKVLPEIYEASYPCWMLDLNEVKNTLTTRYHLMAEYENDTFIFLDGRKIRYRGLLLKNRHENN